MRILNLDDIPEVIKIIESNPEASIASIFYGPGDGGFYFSKVQDSYQECSLYGVLDRSLYWFLVEALPWVKRNVISHKQFKTFDQY